MRNRPMHQDPFCWPNALRILTLVLAGLACLHHAGSARAFNYPEHAWISARALAIFVAQNPVEGPELLSSIRRVVNSPRLCEDPHLIDLEGEGCFSLADFPALSGDHAANPPTLLARWFSEPTGGEMRPLFREVQNALLANLGAAIAHADPGTAPPEDCGSQSLPTSVDAFIDVVRRFAVGEEVVDTGDLDTGLAEIDADYVCLALQGSHHFRVPEIHSSDAAYVTASNALGSYSVYHLQALNLAAISASDANNREKWLGLALLSETFAAHFLQDAAAAGHMVVDYGSLNPASIRATHDAYNETGLEVRIPTAVCQRLESGQLLETFPRLYAACNTLPTDGERLNWHNAVLRGDHSLNFRRGAEEPHDVTNEMAVFLVVESLNEVLAASKGSPDAALTACQSELSRCIDPAPGQSLEVSCTLAWFETPECDRRESATEALSQHRLRPLDMVPLTAQRVRPIYIFSGASLVLSANYRPSEIDFDRFFEGPTIEFVNSIGIGFDYTSPPTDIGALSASASLLAPVLRSGSEPGVGVGGLLRLGLRPVRFLILGLGGTAEVTDPGGDHSSGSSFFFGSGGLELVNVDSVRSRVELDVGCHMPYGDGVCRFAGGLSISVAFKGIAFLGPEEPGH